MVADITPSEDELYLIPDAGNVVMLMCHTCKITARKTWMGFLNVVAFNPDNVLFKSLWAQALCKPRHILLSNPRSLDTD